MHLIYEQGVAKKGLSIMCSSREKVTKTNGAFSWLPVIQATGALRTELINEIDETERESPFCFIKST